MPKDNAETIRVKKISEINGTYRLSTENISNANRKTRNAEDFCDETNFKKVKLENHKNLEENENTAEADIIEGNKKLEALTNPVLLKEANSEHTSEKHLGILSANRDVDPTSHPSTNSVLLHIKPATMVKKEEATSTSRDSCKFGITCYRRNPMHRVEEAHPGDHDYKRPNYPIPSPGTPKCPHWDACYRRNPTHFQAFCHPPEINSALNRKTHQSRLRQRHQKVQYSEVDNSDVASSSGSELDDIDDPFINDSDLDSDYVPSEEENDEKSEEYYNFEE